MPDSDQTPALGFGLAGFMLALHSLGARVRQGEISMDQARETISRSRQLLTSPGGFPGDPAVARFAERALQMAEQLLTVAAAQTPPAGPR